MPISLRAVTALSTTVTAVCAVAVAVHLISTDMTVRVEQLRTFDSVELSSNVADLVREQYPDSGVNGWSRDFPPCTGSVAIKEGVTFTCTFTSSKDGRKKKVRVVVKDTFSGELEVGAPTP
ncbi:MAG: hypothetical protein QOF58_3935 [Pseudonocardiales bacterium]|jgi:hypothetical protein|nr:hypothetical protein [Pseudonocardiales bacterium]